VVLPAVPRVTRAPGIRRPLPDAVAVRRLIVPESAPPFDDEPAVAGRAPGGAAEIRAADGRSGGVCAAAVPRSGAGLPGAARGQGGAGGRGGTGASAAGQGGTGASAAGQAGAAGQGGTGASAAGQAATGSCAGDSWPSQFAQVLAETLAGARPQRQITPWTTENARRRIRQLGPLLAAGQQPRLHRVIASSPAADVVEMTVIVRFGPRVRFLALRLERSGPRQRDPLHPDRHQPRAGPSRWLCTVLEAA